MSTPANMMPPPGTDPSDYATIMRRQAIAQALMQSALSPAGSNLQQPANSVGGKYVEARVSPLSGLSRIAEAVMAKKTGDQSAQDQAQMYARGLQAFGAPAPGQPPSGDGQGGSGGQVTSDAQTPPSAQSAPSSGSTVAQPPPQAPSPNPLNPMGMDPRSVMRLYMSDPAKYLDLIKGTPDWQTALMAYGGNQTQAMAALQHKYQKEGTIEMRQGGETIIPGINGAPDRTIRNPTLGPGEDLQRDANGNPVGVYNLPGSVAAKEATEGAATRGKVLNTPTEVPIGGGAERLMYPGQVPGLTPPQAAPAGPIPAGASPAAAGAAPGAPPPAPATAGPPRPAAAPVTAPPKQYFPPAPGAPTVPPPAAAAPPDPLFKNGLPKLAIPNTPGQTTDAFHQKLLDAAATKHTELVNEYGQQADLANQKLLYNSEALKALPNAEIGPMSEWLTNNRQRLTELGVPASLIPKDGTVTPTLELNKYLLNSALQGARSIYGSRMTQNEVKLQTEEMSPSSHMTADAIQSLIGQDNVRNQYAVQRSQDYNNYVQKGGDPLQFEQWYASRRPIMRAASQAATPPAALDRLKQHPEMLDGFRRQFGWDPSN